MTDKQKDEYNNNLSIFIRRKNDDESPKAITAADAIMRQQVQKSKGLSDNATQILSVEQEIKDIDLELKKQRQTIENHTNLNI